MSDKPIIGNKIAGTRIPVNNILSLLINNVTLKEIATEYYPQLSLLTLERLLEEIKKNYE